MRNNNKITFLGQSWVSDLRTNFELNKKLNQTKISSYLSLSNLIMQNYECFYLPSKNERKNNYSELFNKIEITGIKKTDNYSYAISSSAILIVTYPETIVFDLIFLNIPFVLFFDINERFLTKDSLKWYEEFKELGLAYEYKDFNCLYKSIKNGSIQKVFKSKKFKKFRIEFINHIV